MKTGDYALIVKGIDDVFDGQVCNVLGPDETNSPWEYIRDEHVCILSWTGYLAWTTQDNLVPVAGDSAALERLFETGRLRSGPAQISF